MPLQNLTPEQLALKDHLIHNFDQIKLMVIVSPANGSLRQIDEPRVEYFNPSDCSFRICLPNRRAADISLQSIKEVHLCD
jgi:hypothetical protein